MHNIRILMGLFFFTIALVVILIHQQPKVPLFSTSFYKSKVANTCLGSYNRTKYHKLLLFNVSMVQLKVPITLKHWVEKKIGIEIGALSPATWGHLGIYDAAKSVDGINFATNTLWHSGFNDGQPLIWNNRSIGKHIIRDAVDLHDISDASYEFVCASDVLEHIANPFKALLEWIRVLKSGGTLLIIVPYKNVTFDRKRDIVKMEHLLNDYYNETGEGDLSHLDEIVRLHDIKLDYSAGKIEAFRNRSMYNFQRRGLHQHVFDQELLYYIYHCFNLDVKIQMTWDYHQLIIGQKR